VNCSQELTLKTYRISNMKKLLLSLILATAFFIVQKTDAQTLATMTFNIRYDNPNDGINSWEFRKASVIGLVDHYAPEIFGIQEGLYNQVQYLKNNLKPYKYIGVGREDGKQKGEHSAIFYDTTQYRMIKNSTFWLSEHPEKVSVGWDAALERICTYGLFQNISSGKYIWVFNTHFDHMGILARKMSAELILRKISDLNTEKLPLILMGDFNATADSDPIKILKSTLTEASAVSQKPLYGPVGTFNSFNPTDSVSECIDFIFISKLSVISCTHIDDKKNDNSCISDHYPVIVEIKF
jgi:endonuclease/exonuclease/phosphatase family metal-dependent hydrolase